MYLDFFAVDPCPLFSRRGSAGHSRNGRTHRNKMRAAEVVETKFWKRGRRERRCMIVLRSGFANLPEPM